MSGLEERLKELLDKQEQMSSEVKNSDIISVKEWQSWSKERQDSIIMFVSITCDLQEETDFDPSTFDKETLKYIAKKGLIKVLSKL